MPKRSSKPKREDENQAAARIVTQATGQEPPLQDSELPTPTKNQAAVELGRLGGKKGGPARAAALTTEQRREIARRAANARWEAERNKG